MLNLYCITYLKDLFFHKRSSKFDTKCAFGAGKQPLFIANQCGSSDHDFSQRCTVRDFRFSF